MTTIALMASTMLFMIVINWYLEIRADRFAKRLVGGESIKSALLTLGKPQNFEEPSEDHPSISDRVKLIDKGGL